MKTLLNTSLAVASMALVMTACTSDDEMIQEPNAKQTISFNVTANRATRAANYFGAATDINQFFVSAWVSTGNSYFEGDNITGSTTTGWNYDNNFFRYWPNNGETLDFYAWTNGTYNKNSETNEVTTTNMGTFKWNTGAPTLEGVKQKDAATMNDLIYAATPDMSYGETKPTTVTSAVPLNFRHALAQVGIKAQVVNPKIRVEVESVTLLNLHGEGTMTFPKNTTTDIATWEASGSGLISPIANVGNVTLDKADVATDLTGTNNTFMVMPISGYDAIAHDGSGYSTGTCICMSVKIWNIENATSYKDTDVQIYGKDGGYATIYIPVAFDWTAGKKYTYTITFGSENGNAGLDANGKHTIVKIDWTPSVTPWDEADTNNKTLEN